MRRFRKMTWAIWLWSALMLTWVITAIATRPAGSCKATAYLSKQDCASASNVGTGIGVTLLIVLWFFGFIVLSLIWMMSRPPRH